MQLKPHAAAQHVLGRASHVGVPFKGALTWTLRPNPLRVAPHPCSVPSPSHSQATGSHLHGNTLLQQGATSCTFLL